MSSEESEHFWSYLKEEYSRIAEAHFNTNTTISLFFRYYLIIITAPIAVIGLVISLKPQGGMTLGEAVTLVYTIHLPLIIIFVSAAFIGGLVLWYIINLRADAILYARTVNSIRKQFRDESGMGIEERVRISTLPESSHQPPYLEKSFFLPVVFSFATLNTLYIFFALMVRQFNVADHLDLSAIKSEKVVELLILPVWGWLLIVAFFALHLILYWFLAHHREYSYLRSHSVGLDIDGVLNDHRSQFKKILEKQTGKVIDKDRITIIPVHEDSTLAVSGEEESDVFQDPEYWLTMPPMEGAAYVIEKKMRNSFRLKVNIFTYRPWPDTQKKVVKEEENRGSKKEWRKAIVNHRTQVGNPMRCVGKWSLKFQDPIRVITRNWLKDNGIKFSRLYIEKGNDNTTDPRIKIRNRFNLARKKKLRFFVEDDLTKALKLSYFCEVVFLIDQPYNYTYKDLPPNVLRVKSWEELYRRMRELV